MARSRRQKVVRTLLHRCTEHSIHIIITNPFCLFPICRFFCLFDWTIRCTIAYPIDRIWHWKSTYISGIESVGQSSVGAGVNASLCKMEALNLPCAGQSIGPANQLFGALIQTILAAQCAISPPETWPKDYGPTAVEQGIHIHFFHMSTVYKSNVMRRRFYTSRIINKPASLIIDFKPHCRIWHINIYGISHAVSLLNSRFGWIWFCSGWRWLRWFGCRQPFERKSRLEGAIIGSWRRSAHWIWGIFKFQQLFRCFWWLSLWLNVGINIHCD